MPKDTAEGDRDRVTEYVYGVPKGTGAGDSDIASNDILHKIHYPDETTGNRSTAAGFTVTFAYNRLGEPTYFKDQNGTVHDFVRDDLGRVSADKASTLGTDIDGAVRAIGTTYDLLGRIDLVRSYDDTAMLSTDIVNAVQFTYTKLWQVEDVRQQNDGDVDGNSLKVVYGYDDQSMTNGNWSRKDDLTYPDGESIPYDYGTSGSSGDVISRVFGVAKSGATDEGIQYHYIGLGMTAIVDYANPDVQLDRTAMHNGKRHTHDAWNRLVKVETGEGVNQQTLSEYEYNGLNWRIRRTDVAADPDVDFDYYYNTSWQLLEVRKDQDADPLKQHVWHDYYIDALAITWYDSDVDGANIDELYFTHDANFNVTALVHKKPNHLTKCTAHLCKRSFHLGK